ncbi:MAG: hypothetical protein Q4C76_01130, partial [Bacillota bacterium]|nr:hypothetical protein [Bacillota bacterium]
TIPSPQPAAQPSAPPTGRPASQPAVQPYLPANQGPKPSAQPKPATAPPQTPPAQQAAPAQQGTEAGPAAEPKAEPAPPTQTGVPEGDGPDLITFTPDPKAAEAQEQEGTAAQEEGTTAQQAAPVQQAAEPQTETTETPPQQAAPAQGAASAQQAAPPQQAAGQARQTPPPGGTQTGGAAAAQPPFRLRRERKARPAPEAPPDAPAAQLALEYGQGLKSLKGRCVGAGVLTAILLVLSCLESGFGLIQALKDLLPGALFLPVGMALFVVVAILCADVLKNGLVQLTNRAPDGDTLALLAVIFTLADGLSLLVFHLRTETLPFFAPCGLVLTFHLMGRYLTQSARYQTCRTAASVSKPYVVTQDPNVLNSQPAFRKWIGTPNGFGSQVRTLSDGERRFQRLTPVLLVACIVLSMITTVAHHQPRLAFWSLSALFTAASTLGAAMVFSLPQRLLSGKLSKLGAALAGWPGAAASKGCKAAMVSDYDIYPPGTVTLLTARPFGNWSMDRVVSFAASAVRASGSGLTFVFDRALGNEHGTYLGVEKLILQENGLVAEIQSQQVLVGNSDFMSHQGIALPQGVRAKDAVFCAAGRELIGMFVLRYNLHPAILPALRALFAHKLSPVMVTRDFNLSPQRLRLGGRLPTDQIAFPDLQRRVNLSGPNQVHSDAMVAVLCKEGLPPLTEALIGARRIRRSGRLASLFVNVSACIGVVLTATLSSAGALSSMCAWNLALFLLLWFLPVLLISLWTTQY